MSGRFDALIEVLQSTLNDTTNAISPISQMTTSTESTSVEKSTKVEESPSQSSSLQDGDPFSKNEDPLTPSTDGNPYQSRYVSVQQGVNPYTTSNKYMGFSEILLKESIQEPSIVSSTSMPPSLSVSNGGYTLNYTNFKEISSQVSSNQGSQIEININKGRNEKRHRCWTAEADERLKKAVSMYGERQWKEIAQYVGDKTYVQCAQRWRNVLKSGIKKGHWSLEEDELLRKAYKETEGLRDSKRWTVVSEHVPGKTNKQCRERWNEHLRPEINKGIWTVEEDALLLSLYNTLGSQWSKIASRMNGRTQNNVKSRWKTLNRQQNQKYTSTTLPSLSPMPSL